MMVMVPSVAMLIHGLSDVPAGSVARTAASVFPSAKANDSPAAPIMTWRRDSAISECMMGLFMSRLLRGAFDRAHDALIGPAAADVGAHVLHDLGARRLRFMLQQVGRAHDLAGLAVTTLWDALGEPGFLHRVSRIG